MMHACNIDQLYVLMHGGQEGGRDRNL
jgi:hypothetical protein